MKKEIHPDVKETTISCACGEEFKTKSTKDNIRVEVCSNCHPFYTGTNKKTTKGGRIERFNEKFVFSDDEAEEAELEEDTEETQAENDEADEN